MSRAYTIRLSQSVRRHVRVEDGVKTQLEMLGILSPKEMSELLAGELEKIGFDRDGAVLHRKDDDGVEISIDPDTATVTVRLARDTQLDTTIERSARVEEELLDQGRERLRKHLEADAQGQVEAARAQLTQDVANTLERKLSALQRELDGATTRATGAALKIRARQLGEVKAIEEDPETGELTIKVKV